MMYVCQSCGKSFRPKWHKKSDPPRKFCSHKCNGDRLAKLYGTMAHGKEGIYARSIPVPECGCWIWEGFVGNRGYGVMKHRQRPISAHRASWIVHYGEIPRGAVVMHKCDTPTCVNPDHLRIGTQAENIADRFQKGRIRVGTWPQRPHVRDGLSRYIANITPTIIEEVLAMRGVPQKEIAKRMQISSGTVNNILNGRGRYGRVA